MIQSSFVPPKKKLFTHTHRRLCCGTNPRAPPPTCASPRALLRADICVPTTTLPRRRARRAGRAAPWTTAPGRGAAEAEASCASASRARTNACARAYAHARMHCQSVSMTPHIVPALTQVRTLIHSFRSAFRQDSSLLEVQRNFAKQNPTRLPKQW